VLGKVLSRGGNVCRGEAVVVMAVVGTCWPVWGVPTAVVVGAALLISFLVVASAAVMGMVGEAGEGLAGAASFIEGSGSTVYSLRYHVTHSTISPSTTHARRRRCTTRLRENRRPRWRRLWLLSPPVVLKGPSRKVTASSPADAFPTLRRRS
jgi:hypothetical protein